MAWQGEKGPLFERLGGEAAVAAVVDDFYARVLADPRLRPAFAGVDLAALRRRQAGFLGAALGGPDGYNGRTLREAHAGRGISAGQFNAVAGHLADALAAAGVPPEVVEAVVARVAPLASEVVEPGAGGVGSTPGRRICGPGPSGVPGPRIPG